MKRRTWRLPSPWPFAAFTAILALLWLFVVADSTVGYLSPPLTGAIEAIANTVGGEAPPRALFQSGSSYIAPNAGGAPGWSPCSPCSCSPPRCRSGWWASGGATDRQPFALVFGLAAAGFFGTLALRLAPAAWETGNRASEFLFIGLALRHRQRRDATLAAALERSFSDVWP